VRIEDIVADAIAATNWLFANGPRHGMVTDRVVLSGHSAGGHLTAAVMAAPRDQLAFDTSRIVGAVPVSGVFDFEPLRLFAFNSDFRLDAASIARLNVAGKRPTVAAPMVVAAGADESSEFRRQSQLLADAWKPQVEALLMMPGLNHFSVVDAFAERGNALYEATLALFTRAARSAP
jgi:arylformamidase